MSAEGVDPGICVTKNFILHPLQGLVILPVAHAFVKVHDTAQLADVSVNDPIEFFLRVVLSNFPLDILRKPRILAQALMSQLMIHDLLHSHIVVVCLCNDFFLVVYAAHLFQARPRTDLHRPKHYGHMLTAFGLRFLHRLFQLIVPRTNRENL